MPLNKDETKQAPTFTLVIPATSANVYTFLRAGTFTYGSVVDGMV